jgi:hypothetical protein
VAPLRHTDVVNMACEDAGLSILTRHAINVGV